MRGAPALLHTLVQAGVDTCFMNPGTSEMHFVAALDEAQGMRGVLALFEGVATGAADGYARMAGRPAAVLLHLGPGLANGIANLHNARRAGSPVLAVVGDHATYHQPLDAPLQSDIETLARNCSGWVRRARSTAGLPADGAEAVAAAGGPPGQVATLILPADVSWSDGAEPAPPRPRPAASAPDLDAVKAVATALRDDRPVGLLVGGPANRSGALQMARRLASALSARLLGETFPARIERGGGRPGPERLAYLGEMALAQMAGLGHLVLVGARWPVSFFAYPDKPSDLVPEGCAVHRLAGPGDDAEAALSALAAELGVGLRASVAPTPAADRPQAPDSGPLTAEALARAVAALLPEGAIVADESNTSGAHLAAATAAGPPHDWLTLTGGAIGCGLPLATGAAVACPDRPVVALEADGSAMYTPQALWTMAREGLDVTAVVLANRSYAILNMELSRVGAGAGGPRSRAMLDLHRPDLDFVALARGMGVPAWRAETAGELSAHLSRALATPGPALVEAVMSS
jgi:acetolactate synthase-1/2/3 large subunit